MVINANGVKETVKETDASKLCDSMNEELPESITQTEMECIHSNLPQVDKTKRDAWFKKKKINKMS